MAPRLPFGHGLSYAEFAYGALRLEASSVSAGGTLSVEIDVTNAGTWAGSEVVQLYLGACWSDG